MRLTCFALLVLVTTADGSAQGRFPPDSLVNVQVLPQDITPSQLIGQMRSYSIALGVRCQYCHEGEEGRDLSTFDFVRDSKRPKLVAREMIEMVRMINSRLDALPGREADGLRVTCQTCHRGVSRPIPLAALVAVTARNWGADSAVREYQLLRARYYGGDGYDFREPSLNNAAFSLSRSTHFTEALALLDLNETHYPGSADIASLRGSILLMKGDTAQGAAAFREALRRDPGYGEARERLREIGQSP